MPTQYFDDGSTYTWNEDYSKTSATDAPAGNLISQYSSNITPGNVSAGASSWSDVLKFGIGRIADYKVATLQAQNMQPQYAPQTLTASGNTGAGFGALLTPQNLILAGGAALVFMLIANATSGKKKG